MAISVQYAELAILLINALHENNQTLFFWLTKPTLVRRLLFWQMLLLTVIWLTTLLYSMSPHNLGSEFPKFKQTYTLLAELTEQMRDNPEKRQHFIHRFDLALQQDYGGDMPGFAYRVMIQQGDQIVYRSPHLPSDLHYRSTDKLETLCSISQGSCWYTYTSKPLESDIYVTFLLSQLEMGVFYSTVNTTNFYLTPIIISLPLLLFPAWLTIYIGLRPLNKVIHEVSQRGPRDLTELTFKPKHKELVTMVDNINMLLQRLRTSSARERSFIADAAHELRTPLAAMRIHVEALEQQAKGHNFNELLTGILNSNWRATRLVSQLLNLMRNDVADNSATALIDLESLLQERLAVLSGLALQKNIEVELLSEPELFIDGYREGLISLTDNLVENAIKYSPKESTVTISLHRVDNQIELVVSDRGPGSTTSCANAYSAVSSARLTKQKAAVALDSLLFTPSYFSTTARLS